jgi:hypothetical protein
VSSHFLLLLSLSGCCGYLGCLLTVHTPFCLFVELKMANRFAWAGRFVVVIGGGLLAFYYMGDSLLSRGLLGGFRGPLIWACYELGWETTC